MAARAREYYAGIDQAVADMLPEIRGHAAFLAKLGPRQTGQTGCDAAMAYVRRELAGAVGDRSEGMLEFAAPVTVAIDRRGVDDLGKVGDGDREFSHLVVSGLPDGDGVWPAYALAPNCVQACATHRADQCPSAKPGKPEDRPHCPSCQRPRRLVDLGSGRWEDFNGKKLDDAVVLMDFNSGDAWLRAAIFGAAGVVFIAPDETTVFQADRKYRATLPLNVPRMYVSAEDGAALRKALADERPVTVEIANRLRLVNVPARGLEVTIPGKDRSRCYVFAAHLDARCIVPDLSYGGDEVWGPAELIEIARYLAAAEPACDVRVLFVTGHWQSQRLMRDYVSPGGLPRRPVDGDQPVADAVYDRIGSYFKVVFGVDMVPAGKSLNLITETPWDHSSRGTYKWLGTRLFGDGGWRDQMFAGMGLSRSEVELFGGERPLLAETLEGSFADRNDRSAMVFAPRYDTAEGPWQTLGVPTLGLQTSRLARLHHNTPLDRLGEIDADAADEQLRPQLMLALGTMRSLFDVPRDLMRDHRPSIHRGAGWGGYAEITGRVLQWRREIGWFREQLPGKKPLNAEKAEDAENETSTQEVVAGGPVESGGGASPDKPSSLSVSDADDDERELTTFLYAYPTDSEFMRAQGNRLRNYLNWPMAPSRLKHRELQSFMFQDLRLLDRSYFRIRNVYAALPSTTYDVVGYSLDEAGQIRCASDYGVHGDGNKAFQATDLEVVGQELYVPVSLFECGSLELLGLVDPQRYDPNASVYGSYFHSYSSQLVDRGVAPFLKVSGVKDVQSHTDMERYGFTQYGPDAMIFLPADAIVGAEILLGGLFTNVAVLSNPDASGESRGYRLDSGQVLRLTSTARPSALRCLEQLAALDQQRLEEFDKHAVRSPLAQEYHAASEKAVDRGEGLLDEGDLHGAWGQFLRGWIFESQAYRDTLKLLLDVVATTVLYFVLLIPFSFLVERLVFPQRTVLRTALVAIGVFVVFAAILYMFHPGFKLAHNVIVTTTAFVIVVMTIPALILLLMRGIAMLRAIGSKAVITQHSEAESAGVVMASLSLAVSNMRRRRLRTALTLVTITALVMALVLLTTSSAFDFRILEPSPLGRSSWEGIQVYNASDRRQALLTETVELVEATLADKAEIIRREGVNYGFDPQTKINGCLFLTAGKKRAPLPYFQVMDWRDNTVDYTIVTPAAAEEEGISWFVVVLLGVTALLLILSAVREAARRRIGRAVAMALVAAAAGAGAALMLMSTGEGETTGASPPASAATTQQQDDDQERRIRLGDLVTEGTFLEPGDVKVCLLPNNIAEALGVGVGDTVKVMGLSLTVKGIFAGRTARQEDGKTVYVPGDLDRLTDLDGLPITFLRGAMHRQGETDNPIHAPSSELVIVPRAWIRKYDIFPTIVHSLVVIPKEGASAGTVDRLAEKLAHELLNVEVFSHYLQRRTDPETGQTDVESVANRISMQTATHVKGSSMMLVVLAVAVLMILAIMTGTVYERMREIHIFSSVGLSPRHVAGMFLIEALVYAGIAAVLGYFLGIVALKALLWHLKSTGQETNFYPNYLGVFVVYSIAIAVLATVASALYPIRLAGKIVNPAGGKTWEFADGVTAENVPDELGIRLPFIATTWQEARAMMVYAYDYLVIHQGERSGRFVCESPPAGRTVDRTLELTMPVWLAPFERNLSQTTLLRVTPATDAAWWEMSLTLHRRSGPAYLWLRGAKVFVDMLCKHLLRWRAATEAQEAGCLARAGEVFGND